jgi:hypothetical protein
MVRGAGKRARWYCLVVCCGPPVMSRTTPTRAWATWLGSASSPIVFRPVVFTSS